MWYRQDDDLVTANVMRELELSIAARCGALVLACIDGTISQRELAVRLTDEAEHQQYMQSNIPLIMAEWTVVYDQRIVNACHDRGMSEARRSIRPVILSLTEDHSDLIGQEFMESAHELLEAVDYWRNAAEGDPGDVDFLEFMGMRVAAYDAEGDVLQRCFGPGRLVEILLRRWVTIEPTRGANARARHND
jgi:hypothetical protein